MQVAQVSSACKAGGLCCWPSTLRGRCTSTPPPQSTRHRCLLQLLYRFRKIFLELLRTETAMKTIHFLGDPPQRKPVTMFESLKKKLSKRSSNQLNEAQHDSPTAALPIGSRVKDSCTAKPFIAPSSHRGDLPPTRRTGASMVPKYDSSLRLSMLLFHTTY
jgi:hypothetical protein